MDSSDLKFSIGQGRPVGLSYSNNVLSVIIAIYSGIVLAFGQENNRLKYSDIILAMVIVLSGSLTSLAITIILIILLTVFGIRARRMYYFKFFFLLITGYYIYFLLFPGVFKVIFSYVSIWDSVLWRVLDLASVTGYNDLFRSLLSEQISMVGLNYNISSEKSYSGFSILLKVRFIISIGIILIITSILYFKKYKKLLSININQNSVYIFTLLTCLLSQFGVPYYNAPIFQIVLGFSLYPIFSSYRSFQRKSNLNIYRY